MKRLLAILMATALISIPCVAQEKDSKAAEEVTDLSETTEVDEPSETTEVDESSDDTKTNEASISGFRSYEWGTSYEDISKDLDLESMDKTDYSYEESDDDAVLTLNSVTIGGYPTTASFYFLKDELVGGSYDLVFDYTLFNDTIRKFTTVYGEPWLESLDSLTLYPAAMWKDEDQNMILVAGNDQLFYLSSKSEQTTGEGWGEYYSSHYGFNPELGLQLEENKDNLEGI